MKYTFCWVVAVLLAEVHGQEFTEVVTTDKGAVRGRKLRTAWKSKPYSAFMGMPFAKPPVGDLRFMVSPILSRPVKRRAPRQLNYLIYNIGNNNEQTLHGFLPEIAGPRRSRPMDRSEECNSGHHHVYTARSYWPKRPGRLPIYERVQPIGTRRLCYNF